MKIKSIHLKDLKRFKELTISDLPESAKLVVLVGPNGCGKSSLFDAIYTWSRQYHFGVGTPDYFNKKTLELSQFSIEKQVDLDFHDFSLQDHNREAIHKTVYARTAYRNVPSFDLKNFGQVADPVEENRFSRFIDDDRATGNNYSRLVSQSLENLYSQEGLEKTKKTLQTEIIGDIANALRVMFPELILNSLGYPLGTFEFDKGVSKGFRYENLSGGEKAAFDLILDLVVKKRTFDNTVYCIDEPEAHMSTRLQKDLLASLYGLIPPNCQLWIATHSIYGLIPPNCQLWIATHSIGMVRKAQEIQRDNPDEVVFLDLGDRDFDVPQVIELTKPTRTFWQSMYEVALDDLATLVVPERIILCEGNAGRDGFDAQCYNKIFGNEFPNTLFVSARGKSQVKILAPVIQAIAEGSEVISLTDRDGHSDTERQKARQEGSFILKRRTLENYLLDDEILKILCKKESRPEIADTLINLRDDNITPGDVRSGKAKAAAVKIYEVAEDQLDIEHPGAVYTTFLIEHFAPLITPDTAIYKELKTDIFGA